MSHEGKVTLQHGTIPIQKHDELPLIYQLLESFIKYPELALSITEIIFLPKTFSVSRFHNPATEIDKEFVVDETKRDVSQETLLFRGIKALNLSAEHEEKWVRTLTWMKPEVVERRQPLLQSSSFGSYFTHFVNQQDRDFLYHATALLLTLCPNIERFVYRDNIPINPVEETLKRINYGLLPDSHLQQVKGVVLVGADGSLMAEDGLYVPTDVLNLLSMFHRLPSIESISAAEMDSPRHSYVDTFPPGTSNIRNIKITQSSFGSDIVAALIRAPRALEELTITTGGYDSWDGSSPMIYAKEVGKALRCQRSSLRKLEIDLGYFGDTAYYKDPEDILPADDNAVPIVDWEEFHRSEHRRALISRQTTVDETEAQGPLRAMRLPDDHLDGTHGETIGSLHDHEKLTHLSISLQHLRGGLPSTRSGAQTADPPFKLIDALPPNLEFLHIRGYKHGQQQALDDEFAEILREKSTRFPKLQQIYGVGVPVAEGETVSHDDL